MFADDALLHAAVPLVFIAFISPLLLLSGAYAAVRDLWRRRRRLAREAGARLAARVQRREKMIARLVKGEDDEDDAGDARGEGGVGVNQHMKSAAEILAEARVAASVVFNECFAEALGCARARVRGRRVATTAVASRAAPQPHRSTRPRDLHRIPGCGKGAAGEV